MSERDLWHDLRGAVTSGHWVRVENAIVPGTPDVNWAMHGTEGWLELKEIPCWPKPDAVVRVDHFTREQRIWLKKRRAAGGTAHLLLRVSRSKHVLLFDGLVAAAILGLAVRADLERQAMFCVQQTMPWNHIRAGLLGQDFPNPQDGSIM